MKASGAYGVEYPFNVRTSRQRIVETLAVGYYIQNFKSAPNVHLYRSLSPRPNISPSHDTFTSQYLRISLTFLSENEAD